jgi:hypothetical protein
MRKISRRPFSAGTPMSISRSKRPKRRSAGSMVLGRFVAPTFAVGVRLEADDAITVAAPFGLEDVFAMLVRPNPNRPLAKGWARTVENARGRWPELTVVESV